jgi:hypothetical protein
VTASLSEDDLELRLREARRALLAHPLLTSEHDAFGVVRAHAERLRSEFHTAGPRRCPSWCARLRSSGRQHG